MRDLLRDELRQMRCVAAHLVGSERRRPKVRRTANRPSFEARRRRGLRFLSIEPLLEDLGEVNLSGIDWSIWCVNRDRGVMRARLKPEWVTSILDQL